MFFRRKGLPIFTSLITVIVSLFLHPQNGSAGRNRYYQGSYKVKKITTLTKRGGRVDWSHSGNNLIAFDRRNRLKRYDVYVMKPNGSGATEALGQEKINKLRDISVENIKEGKRVEAFTDAIEEATQTLSEKPPPEGDNPDEIDNGLLVFHPRP